MNRVRPETVAYFAISTAVFVYVAIRAVIVGITYDEMWTISVFVPQSVFEIINYTVQDANNHILNTLLIKLFTAAGSESLLVSRLPNVLAFIVYAYFSYRITSRFLSSYFGIATFILLIINPFVLDFFGLARGYGLSMAFQMTSIYYFLSYFHDWKPRHAILSVTLGGLAVLSNFSLLIYWATGLLLIVVLPLIVRPDIRQKKTLLYSGVAAFALIALIYEPIRKLLKSDLLYYGGNAGFYTDTLTSLTRYSLYNQEDPHVIHWVLNLFLIILVASVWSGLRGKTKLVSPGNILLLMLILCVGGVMLQHYILGSLFPIDRTALFFYPLLILVFGFSLQAARPPRLFRGVLLVSLIIFGINFALQANIHKTAIWDFESRSESILNRINEIGRKENKMIGVDFSWPVENSMKYYYTQNQYSNLVITKDQNNRDAYNGESDYYIFLNRPLHLVGYNIKNQEVTTWAMDTLWVYEEDLFVLGRQNP